MGRALLACKVTLETAARRRTEANEEPLLAIAAGDAAARRRPPVNARQKPGGQFGAPGRLVPAGRQRGKSCNDTARWGSRPKSIDRYLIIAV